MRKLLNLKKILHQTFSVAEINFGSNKIDQDKRIDINQICSFSSLFFLSFFPLPFSPCCFLCFFQIRTKNHFLTSSRMSHLIPALTRLSLFLPTHQNLNNSNVLIATNLPVCRFQIWKIKEISWIASWKSRKGFSQLMKDVGA